MSAGRDKQYKNPRKNNARLRAWNEVGKRTPDKKSAVVLYLSGRDDLDRPVAIRHGFRADNLIAVDSDRDVVRFLRSRGKLAVHSDLLWAAAQWPKPVDVIFADFCNGFTDSNFRAAQTFLTCNATHRDTVVYINMLRGREHPNTAKAFNFIRSSDIFDGHPVQKSTNRAELLYFFMWYESCIKYWEKTDPEVLMSKVIQDFNHRYAQAKVLQRPKCLPYKSDAGSQRFDGLVYTSGMSLDDPLTFTRREPLDKQISAVLATRTKRMTGVLPHSPRE